MAIVSPYLTKNGDVLDAICYAYYGFTVGAVEAVYGDNPALASMGMVLPAGVLIVLPDLTQPATTTEALRLWT